MKAGKGIAGNALWNLTGRIVPLAVALVTIPLLLRGLGTDRFGILALVWVFIGYFSLFDLGLARALTQKISAVIGSENEGDLPSILWNSLFLMLLLGSAGGLLVLLLSSWAGSGLLRVPPHLQSETVTALRVMALSIPFLILAAGLRGILEAYQRFDLVNAVQIPTGVLMYAAPLLVLPWSGRLPAVVAVLVACRIGSFIAFSLLCFARIAPLRHPAPGRRGMGELLATGGWMTVSNGLNPLLMYADRLLIGVVLSTSLVAYYAAPYEVAIKLLILPGALAAVLFPALSSSLAGGGGRAAELFGGGTRVILALFFPVVLVIVTFADEGLSLWLGAEFAARSATVLRLLAAGALLNGLGRVPFVFLQADGRADLTAKVHLAELPAYLLLLWVLLGTFGIEGAALAWLIRVGVDTAILTRLSLSRLPGGRGIAPGTALFAAALAGAIVTGALLDGSAARAVFLTAALPLFAASAWSRLLREGEREVIRTLFRVTP